MTDSTATIGIGRAPESELVGGASMKVGVFGLIGAYPMFERF